MDPNRTYEGEEMEPDYADDHIPDNDTAGDSSSHPEEIEDMKKRLKEMEEEAGALREMQAKVEKEMGSSATSDPANAAADATQAEKEEVDSRSIYVGNVDYGCSPEEVQQHFQSCGTVNRVTILTDRGGQPKGFAYVEFDEVEAVQNAILLNESELHGRQLKVEIIVLPCWDVLARGRVKKANFKKKPVETHVSVKRTNVPGMKQHRGGRRPYFGGFRPGPYMAPPFYAPYAYGKAPRYRRPMGYRPY